MVRTASCSCGQLTLACDGEPVRVGICHCFACQKRTGSAFGLQARFDKARVTPAGDAREYVRVGDDGGHLTFRFCTTCGATISYVHDAQPDVVGVPVGAFADPTFPAPSYSVYDERRHPWVRVPEGVRLV